MKRSMYFSSFELQAKSIKPYFLLPPDSSTARPDDYHKYKITDIYNLHTCFRFLKQEHDWTAIRLCLLKAFAFKQDQHFIAAADEVVSG